MKTSTKDDVSGSGCLTMTRAAFLRTLGLGAAGIAGSLAGLGPMARASGKTAAAGMEVDVYPTGVFPTDVLEVRAAVNGGTGPSGRSYSGGGTVRLKARNLAGEPTYFNFGDGLYPSGRDTVEITKDVTILGELTAPMALAFPNGRVPDLDFPADRTVIYGGKRPFACRPESPDPTRLVVRKVYFAYPSLAAVQVAKSAGLEVSDCIAYEVEWDATNNPTLPRVAVGIEATGGVGPDPQPNPNLFGEFKVINNRIRRAPAAVASGQYSQADTGIVLQRTLMNAQISANEVSLFAFGGIGLDRNHGTASLVGNLILQCAYGPTGISAGIGARGTTLPVAIERNSVTCGSCGPSLQSRNGIFVASENVVVRANTVRGAVLQNGLMLSTFLVGGVTFAASGNRIFSNQLDQLTAGRAQVFLSAQCNSNQFTNNEFGAVAATSGLAGMVVQSNDNQLVNEHFWGVYPGVSGSPSLPCIWLQAGSFGNKVTALKYGDTPEGADLCGQVRNDGANIVPGYSRCKPK